MKKILVFSLILALTSATASAQSGHGNGLHQNRYSRSEKMELRKDLLRNGVISTRVHRDGVVTPMERRRMHRAKCDTRRDLIRFSHNGRHKII